LITILRFPANGLQVDIQQLHWSPLYVTGGCIFVCIYIPDVYICIYT
jgi:hypothetical protein